ncbi:MAG: hypothetical protein QM710_07945 [Flavobacterium sp.]
MKTKILFLFVALTLLTSCSQHQFSQFDTFGEDNHWLHNDVKIFEFEIVDDAQLYDVNFRFSHVYGYQFPTVPIRFVIESPDGNKENLSVDLALKDSGGKEVGDCAGDICDLEYPVKNKARLIKGKYKITVSHDFKEAAYLPNVIGVGLNVDSVK